MLISSKRGSQGNFAIVSQRKGKKRTLGARLTPSKLIKANDRWSLDFVHDLLQNGRPLCCMTIVDDYSRTCLGIVVDSSLTGQRVCEELSLLISLYDKPARLVIRGQKPIEAMKISTREKKSGLTHFVGYVQFFNKILNIFELKMIM